MPTFNGDDLLITLDSGVLNVNIETDLYSEWKEWMVLSDNAKYLPAFATSGGDSLIPGLDAGSYFFLRNDLGWRIRPAEEDLNVTLTGNLFPQDPDLPMIIPTVGNYTVLINGLQPITQGISDLLTSQALLKAIKTLLLAE
jgi:hypothetical protein